MQYSLCNQSNVILLDNVLLLENFANLFTANAISGLVQQEI